MLSDLLMYPPILGLGGLAIAFVIFRVLNAYDQGDGEIKSIGDQIHLGAMVFMQREY